jgi:hypothetical protein
LICLTAIVPSTIATIDPMQHNRPVNEEMREAIASAFVPAFGGGAAP